MLKKIIQDGLKLNGTHQLLGYADDDILDRSVHNIKKRSLSSC